MLLFLHEVHRVRGVHEEAFEAAFREGWMPAVGDGDDARLLWYCHQPHGAGPAYRHVTITAFRNAAAWERVAERVQTGDLRPWAREIDGMRHDGSSKLLVQVPWSPLGNLDLAAVPAEPQDHDHTLYMEDTGWPHVPLDDYTGYWERVYLPLINATERKAPRLLEVEAVFQVAHGTGRRPEAILMQKVVSHEGLLRLLATEVPAKMKEPGTFMHDALQYRDQWESRLLRTTSWSPMG